MARRPQRTEPKTSVQLTVDRAAYEGVRPLREARAHYAKSFSRFFEDLLFLEKSAYIEDRTGSFIDGLASVKADRYAHIASARQRPADKAVHMTLDIEAYRFLSMLQRQYRALFTSRSEIATLLLAKTARFCTNDIRTKYLARRLDQIARNHPRRGENV